MSLHPSLLQVTDLTQAYWNKKILHGISFTLAEGSLTLLTGPNGAGKTTLLKVLAGLLHPLKGSVRYAGANPQASLFIPESSLYLDLTVAENLNLYADLDGVAKSAIEPLAKAFQLTGFLNEPVRNLSRGQRHRAALAKTFLKPADFFLLDEPFIGLDEAGCGSLKTHLASLKQSQKTLVIATHDLAPLQGMIDGRLELNNGRLGGQA